MAITASEVNKLRQQTGAGMMDCKNALVEANGDFETAIDILRKKGQKIAAKRGENDASEGLVLAQATADGKSGVVLALNCETDFVSKNDDFLGFSNGCAKLVAEKNPADVSALATLSLDSKTVEAIRAELIGKIDSIIEAYQGWYGLIGEVRMMVMSKKDVAEAIRTDLTWMGTNREKICKKNTMMENLIDDLMQLYSTTHYKLVNLK
jgi:translation elongation factor EF-Ts